MHILFRLFLLACLLSCASACGKKKKHAKTQNNDQQNTAKNPAPAPAEDNLGSDVSKDTYSSSGSDAVTKCEDLNCNFDSGCCWEENEPPADQLNWVKASGQPDSAKMQSKFSSSSAPDGGYLIVESREGGTSDQTAQMYSCPITCSQGITVSVKHWQSSGNKIEICTFTDPASDSPSECKSLPSGSGKEDSVTLPGGDNKRVVIQSKGFATSGTMAIIDDITVKCEPCAETTTPEPAPDPTPAPPPPAPPAAVPPCKEVQCNFEEGNPCAYSASTSKGNAQKNWEVCEAPWHNPLTGLKKNDEGKKCSCSYLKKGGEKTTMTTKANFDQEYWVCFDYYKATEGVNLKACCESESSCQFDTTPDVQVSHYKVWRTACISCPSGTKQVHFVSENQKGTSEGAVAVDNIRLLKPSGGAPNQNGSPACTT